MQPRVEPVSLAEAGQVPPGSDERVLDGILGEVWIPNDQPGGGVEPPDRAVDELGEGSMIASPCPIDERSLIHGRLVSGMA
jgi:hypothetical protein